VQHLYTSSRRHSTILWYEYPGHK